jgi:hypothetical protein
MKRKLGPSKECVEIFAALSEFVDGTLPARSCRGLRAHLRDCKPCIQYLDTIRKTIRWCQVYPPAPAPPPSPAVREALMQALAKTPTRRHPRRPHTAIQQAGPR